MINEEALFTYRAQAASDNHSAKLTAELKAERARSAKLIEEVLKSVDCTDCGEDIRYGVKDAIAEYEKSRG